MSLNIRYLTSQVENDLKRKMVFIGGPRQVGKTTLAKNILKGLDREYLNWDSVNDRKKILKGEFLDKKILIFDELHKYKKWRNYIKGIYDTLGETKKIILTGSAMLDYYRFGGDSLQGRYHYLRLFPFSVSELKIKNSKDFLELLELGGFPEPFSSGSKKEANRWSSEYSTRFIHEDLRDLENISDIGSMELLYTRLPECVGSPLSINSFREDLQVHHSTIKRYIEIAERLYAIFRLAPVGLPQIKAVKKEQKHYHMDWNLIESNGARFENLVAVHLLKHVSYLQDTEAQKIELRYFRDKEGA